MVNDMFDKEIKVDDKGLNADIQSHLLSEEKMREIGFTDFVKEKWYYCKEVQFPKESRYRNFEITFNVSIPKNGDRLRIDVLDEDFCQPYDYQRMLNKNSKFEPALIVFEFVEKQMEYLQQQGVISGHIYGEYI